MLHLPTFGLSLQEKDCIWVNTQTIIILWTHSVLPIIDKNSMLPLYSPCLRHRALNYISMLASIFSAFHADSGMKFTAVYMLWKCVLSHNYSV